MKLKFYFGFYLEIYVLERMLPTDVMIIGKTRESLDSLYKMFKSKKL